MADGCWLLAVGWCLVIGNWWLVMSASKHISAELKLRLVAKDLGEIGALIRNIWVNSRFNLQERLT